MDTTTEVSKLMKLLRLDCSPDEVEQDELEGMRYDTVMAIAGPGGGFVKDVLKQRIDCIDRLEARLLPPSLPQLRADPTPVTVASPSKANANHLIDQGFVHFESELPPVFVQVAEDYANCFAVLMQREMKPPFKGLLEEATYYPSGTMFAPSWIHVVQQPKAFDGDKLSVEAVFQGMSFTRPMLTYSAIIEPELFITVKHESRGCAGFNSEMKSVPTATLFEEMAQYVALSMTHSYFNVEDPACVYYTIPPVGYGLVGMGNVGYLLVLEWIGKIFMTPLSATSFFMESRQHQ